MKNLIRKLRTEREWTQQYLGGLVGTSRQAIIAIENGKFDPSLPLAMRLARAFDRTIEEIFFSEE